MAFKGITKAKKIVPPGNIRRDKPEEPRRKEPEKVLVNQGEIGKLIDLTFNSSREKMPEFTQIDRFQGRLLPMLGVIDTTWEHFIEIATYRQDADTYKNLYFKEKPVPPNLMQEYMYRLAQWQKSIGGKNLQSAVDLALAETEARSGELEDPLSGHGFEES